MINVRFLIVECRALPGRQRKTNTHGGSYSSDIDFKWLLLIKHTVGDPTCQSGETITCTTNTDERVACPGRV